MENQLVLYTGETEITDGLADESLDDLTLELVIESLDRLTKLTVSDAAITKSDTTWTATLPSAVTATFREWRYALRKTSTSQVMASGIISVYYGPGTGVSGIGTMVVGSTFVVG
jgi:hypothetical protein